MKIKLQLLLLLTTFFMLPGVNAAFTFDDEDVGEVIVDNATSIKQLKSLSDSGSIEAQVKLATLYFKGERTSKDRKKAIEILTKAAKDSPKAQGYLAHIYAGGYGVRQNDAIAIEWIKKHRQSKIMNTIISIPEADIALRFEDVDGYGLGTTIDWIEATKWHIKAAKLGLGTSQLWLGVAYEKGYSHVVQSYEKAVYWYEKAIDAIASSPLGYKSSQAEAYLGVLYLEGLGVRADKEKGMHLIFEKNIENFKYRCELALNRTGYSLVRYGEAYTNLIKQCSELGSPKAQYDLAWAYQQGKGVPENYILAYKWMTLAASKAKPDDLKLFHNDLKLLRNSFTQYQIQKGQDLAGDWFPKKYKAIKSKKSKTNKSKGYSSGTGFYVNKKGLMITNNHVVKSCNKIKVDGSNAVVKLFDTTNDLALLKVDSSPSSVPDFRAGRGIRLGDGVTVAGYPLRSVLGSGLNVVTGTVASLSGIKNNSSRLQITAPVNSGNSGGPLFDSSGRVVGVIVSKINNTKAREILGEEIQGANFAIKGSVVRSFLDMNDVDYEVSSSNKNMSTADIAENAKEYTALIKCWK
jgi:uncharacterized protein